MAKVKMVIIQNGKEIERTVDAADVQCVQAACTRMRAKVHSIEVGMHIPQRDMQNLRNTCKAIGVDLTLTAMGV